MSGRTEVADYGKNYCHQQIYAEYSKAFRDGLGEIYGYPRGCGEGGRRH
jgi:hypothetical protein